MLEKAKKHLDGIFLFCLENKKKLATHNNLALLVSETIFHCNVEM